MAKNIMDGFQTANIILHDHSPDTKTGYIRAKTNEILSFDMIGILVDLDGIRSFIPWGEVAQIEEIPDAE